MESMWLFLFVGKAIYLLSSWFVSASSIFKSDFVMTLKVLIVGMVYLVMHMILHACRTAK